MTSHVALTYVFIENNCLSMGYCFGDCFSHCFLSLTTAANTWKVTKNAPTTRIHLRLVMATTRIRRDGGGGAKGRHLVACQEIILN